MNKKVLEVIKDMLETATFCNSAIELCIYTGKYDGEQILDIFSKEVKRIERRMMPGEIEKQLETTKGEE